jgi:BolA family transcriptional regulator, general stress-responsive regulator
MTAATVQEIRRRLESALHPLELDVLDEGYKHVGHANEGKGHYHVRIVSAEFTGILPIKRHRMVYAALSEMMDGSIHALSIDARDK